MASLQLVEGLIGTACAIACLYYARLGMLATGPRSSVQTAPSRYGALMEYARQNPFAAVFGALALGFLVSSWSMYALPRPAGTEPRPIEKWHTVTKNVPVPDPAQAAKIATLQNTVTSDATTIATQQSEIDRLKQILTKYTSHRGARSIASSRDVSTEEGTAATLNRTFNPANAAQSAQTPPPSAATQSTVTAPPPGTPPATPGAASQSPSGTPPH